jgi:hypothetical protein
VISKWCSYWSACVSNSAAIGPLLTQERLANQEEENAALQRMLEEQQHVIKLALARILPAKKQDTYFCEVGNNKTNLLRRTCGCQSANCVESIPFYSIPYSLHSRLSHQNNIKKLSLSMKELFEKKNKRLRRH